MLRRTLISRDLRGSSRRRSFSSRDCRRGSFRRRLLLSLKASLNGPRDLILEGSAWPLSLAATLVTASGLFRLL